MCCVCVCPGEGNVAFNATPNPFHLNKICLNQVQRMEQPLTKRGILSMLSSVYDPLGLASPFVLRARRIVQRLCDKKVDWDEPIPEIEEDQWK